VANDNIQDIWSFPNIFLNEPRPIVALTFALNYAVGRLNIFGYHIVNLTIHIMNGFLIFCLAKELLRSKDLTARYGEAASGIALSIGLIWLAHPLQTESVTYIVQRYESMASMFYLLTLYCAVRGFNSKNKMRWYTASILSFVLGMGSKEIVATAPLMILICQRIFFEKSLKKMLRENKWFYMLLAVSLLLTCLRRFYAPNDETTAGLHIKDINVINYAVTQLGAIAHYIKLIFWPVDLCLDYRWPIANSFSQVFPEGAVTILLLISTLIGLKYKPPLGFLGVWFFLILAPSSSFVPLKDAFFEHRVYLASVSLIAGAVIGGFELISFNKNHFSFFKRYAEIISTLSVLVAMMIFGSLTFQRNLDYSDPMKIWLKALKKNPQNDRAYFQIGFSLSKQNHFDEAIEYYNYALLFDSGKMWEAYLKIGEAYYQQGKFDQAFENIKKAIAIQPKVLQPYFELGTLYLAQGNIDEAIKLFDEVLKRTPKAYRTCNNLGIAYMQKGDTKQAIYYFKKALEIKPNYQKARENLDAATKALTGNLKTEFQTNL
jgi:Tfp pilus assembly protein PilF